MTNSKLHKKINFRIPSNLFGFGTSPEADWKIIFVSLLVLALLVVGLCAYVFLNVDKQDIFMVGETKVNSEQVLDLVRLKETILYYQEKALQLEKIKRLDSSSVDPSI